MDNRQKILLPDDPELFCELENSFLQRADMDVIMARRDGTKLVELVARHRPDVAFVDLELPGISGADCCRRIKADQELAGPVGGMLAVAGHPDEIAACRDAGCDGVLLKPIRRKDFMEVARKHLKVDVRAGGRLRAEVRVYYGPKPQKLLDNFSVDMSTGGLYIQTEHPLPVGEELTLRFSLPNDQKTISCKAQVAWHNDPDKPKKPNMPAGMGVQFTDLSLDDLHSIRRFLEHSELDPSW